MWSSWSRAGFAVDAAASARDGTGRAGSPCELETACRRTALSGFVASTCRWQRAQRRRPLWRQRAVRTAKPCGPGRRCCGQASSGDVREPNRADGIVNSRGEGDHQERSAPGRARHKPSNHRAGKAECWASPVCCCAVFLRYTFAQQTAGASRHPAFPAPSWI